jgi:hypothetical protein
MGKTPVIRLNAKRGTANMISAVTNQGKVRFIESGRAFIVESAMVVLEGNLPRVVNTLS